MNPAVAIDRTVRLLQADLFPTLSTSELVSELTSTNVVLRADATNLMSPAGQTALLTSFIALAQMGIELTLDIPELEIAIAQPPLRGDFLRQGLLDLGNDLILPPVTEATTSPQVTVLLGDTTPPSRPCGHVLRLGGGDWAARIRVGEQTAPPRFTGELPFGALLAGAACAAEVLRIISARVAAKRGLPITDASFPLDTTKEVSLELPPLDLPRDIYVGALDFVSAGAITNACLFALLRVPGVLGSARVIDDDRADETNLNRYLLLRRSLLKAPKVDVLATYSTEGFKIEPVPCRLTEESITVIGPLRDRCLVGVDHIRSRWLAQRHCTGWLCVAGTDHFAAMASEHLPDMPCAGCLHPRDDGGGPTELPTISFVSSLAGTLQAYRLLAQAIGRDPAPPTYVACSNLASKRALTQLGLAANPTCPVGCAASRALIQQKAM
jgi:hypothetical protein